MSEDTETLAHEAAASPESEDAATSEPLGETPETEAAAAEAGVEAAAEAGGDEAVADDATAEVEPEATEADEPVEAAAETEPSAETESVDDAGAPAEGEEEPEKAAETAAAPAPQTPAAQTKAADEKPEIAALRASMKANELVDGKVIGWNNGGFHVVIGSVAAFCPRSEMEDGKVNEPKSYLDQTLPFRIIKIQQGGKRVVLSRSAAAREQRASDRQDAIDSIEVGAVIVGRVTSLVDFGAFVDIGGVEGLVHVSQIARRKVDKPSDVLELGQDVEVKILKIENGGKRISLSMKALEHDPWTEAADQFPAGTLTEGVVERTANFGAIVELAPNLTGLLPASTLSIPPDSTIARAYPVGKKLSVMVMSVDPRRRRISLALEGATQGGTVADYKEYQQSQSSEGGGGFNALADALAKLKGSSD